jgi:hypothetical protein
LFPCHAATAAPFGASAKLTRLSDSVQLWQMVWSSAHVALA